MAFRSRFRSPLRGHRPTPLAAAAAFALVASGSAHAQAAVSAQVAEASPASTSVQSVQVTGRAESSASDLTGFGTPLARTPMQATVVDAQTLADIGALTLSDLPRLDASVVDAYNAPGYWTTFSIRGFQVDNRYNFRRDGLPINAETMLPLENKSGVEILKGLSGMQAGTSAPGGLVNLVVKRPDVDMRSASLLWEQDGTLDARVDLSQRFGENRQFGARLNASAAHLDPVIHDMAGHRQTASLATDWRIDADRLLEFEFEHGLQSQPSMAGFSMLGPVVPDPHAIDPRLNLNDQPWSQPVVMQGNTMSLRYTQRLDGAWSMRLQAMQQRLVSNDHLAFPYGLYDPQTYECDPCDRYSSDGRFSIWDYRSDDERRRTGVLDASLNGEFVAGGMKHSLTVGALESDFTARFQDAAYNLVGTGTIDGQTMVPPDPSLTSPNVNRDERSTELYARDAVVLAADTTAWLGVRHSRLHRSAWQTTDPQRAAPDFDYRQSFTTPWLALSQAIGPQDMVYASWGEGIQSSVAPALGDAVNHGEPLSPTISRQWELGWKHGNATTHWGADVFDVRQAFDTDITNAQGETVFAHDGVTHARGLEAEAQTRFDALSLRASAMWQRVRREGASTPSDNGLRPTNVPASALALLATYAFADAPGLVVLAGMTYEGERDVLPDNSVQIPAWTRFDLGARYTQSIGAATLVWRAGVDNVFDRRAWRESPYQYDHVYLYPLEPRTWRASVEANF